MARYIVQHRRGSTAQWADKSTTIPLAGEIVIEIDDVNGLHKLKIGDGVHTYAELAYLMAGDEVVTQVLAQTLPRVVTVTLDVDQWTKVTCATDPKLGYYAQTIALDGITVSSRLDLQPNADMLAEFKRLHLVFVTENNGGTITVYSVGDMPLSSYTMQATIIETDSISENEPVVGMPVGTPTTQADWLQDDETQADYILNKPTIGTLASKNEVAQTDLSADIQASLNKADSALQSFTETDPTVPAWAKEASKPTYTASEVGADVAGAASTVQGNLDNHADNTTIHITATERTNWNAAKTHADTAHDYIPTSQKGASSGVAELDANGKVPTSQLPSFVDDVIEGTYVSTTSFKNTSGTDVIGETGKIYVDTSTNKTYRWSGSAFAEISASIALGETSSTAYRGDRGKIAYDHSQSGHLTLGETSTTAYRGDRGKTAYDHSQATHARTDATATAASSTNGNIKINGTETTVYTHPTSHAASMITGLATVATSGSYNDLTNKPTIPAVDSALSTSSTNPVQNKVITAELNKKVGDFSIEIYNGTGGNPKPVRFASFNYSTCVSEEGIAAKISLVSGHGNGSSYAFLEDAIFRVNYQGGVEVDNFKYYGQAVSDGGVARQYGDIFWLVDTTNKIVDFYVLMGQYSRVQQTPWKRLTYSSKGTVTQYTSCTVYSSGEKHWANNSEFVLKSDIDDLGGGVTYSLSKSGSTITLTGSDGSTTSVSDADTTYTHPANHPASMITGLATVATSGSYNDLTNKPSIPTVNNATLTIQKNGSNVATFTANSSTNATANITVPTGAAADKGVDTSIAAASTSTNLPTSKAVAAFVEGKGYKTTDNNTTYSFASGTTKGAFSVTPSGGSAQSVSIYGLATVATSGSYNDLSNKPSIPTVNNATLTIQKNGSNVATFTANSSTNATANITVPTKTSELTNDSGFKTTDNNTTYTLASGDSNGQIKVTPSSGSAYNVSVKGLGSAAYTASTAYATAAQGTLASNALPKAGGNITGHIYLTGANSNSSTGSTSQIVFGTASNNHVVLSSNNNALVINPETGSTTNQIVLYLDNPSQFPSGISTSSPIYEQGTALSSKYAPKYQYSTTDLTAGSSSLATGTLYFVYE